jgi:hypothetical protein
MGKLIFLGYYMERYRMIDSVSFKIRDYTLDELKGIKYLAHNWHIGFNVKRETIFVPEDGLVYGRKSSNSIECMNTYTIVGYALGAYIITDFLGKELFVLRNTEMLKNKELWIKNQLTNAVLYPRVGVDGQYGLDIMPYNAGYRNEALYGTLRAREGRVMTMSFLHKLYSLRKDTILSGKYMLDKVGKYNIKILDSNMAELEDALNNKEKFTCVDLERLLRCERSDKPMIDTFFINQKLYAEWS